MEFTGRVFGVSRDYITKKPVLQFLVNEDLNGIEDLEGKDLKIKVSKATKPRSLDANAYFHVLCDKLRQKLGISMSHMKNILITSYGQIDYIAEGESAVFKSNIEPERIQESEVLHMKFLKRGDDGAYWYRLYRGSHTYNTAEMHQLLEGTIYEAKEQGIETETPDEIRKMEALWEEKGVKNEQHI